MFNVDLLLDNILPFLQSQLGAILFVPLYAVWVTFLLPGVWASMLAGALYGTFIGSILVFIGASLGAILSFLLGRTIFRDSVQNRLKKIPKLQALLKAVSKEGFKLIFLTRLSPAFPFSLLNFTYGLSEVSLRDYSIGLIGILPGTILFCGLGELAGEVARFGEILSDKQSLPSTLLNILGLVATLLVIWIINISLKNSIEKLD